VGKVAKIAVGCVAVLFLAGVALVAALGGLAWWGKGKLEQVRDDQSRIEEAQKRANAIGFIEPSDGVITEDRLVKFLDIRKRVFEVYEKHRAEIDAAKSRQRGDLGDITKAYNVLTEVRTVQAEALADVGMSTDEYQYLVRQVYKSMWATEVAKSTGGKSVSEATGAAFDSMADALKASGNASPEAQKAMEQMKAQASEAQRDAKQFDVPPANIELFRKYESDIKKYAMGGLEFIGL
jgi:hypothetical protein